MQRKLRFPSPAMVVACIALLIALAGTSYAAIRLPANSVGPKQLKRNAVISAKVRDHSLLAADFKPNQLPRGPQGFKGEKGEKGDMGAPGAPGPFPDGDLPAGKTLRGNWIAGSDAGGAGEFAFETITFGFRLASAPTAHLLASGAPQSTDCPGSLSSPEAAQGHLCIYTFSTLNVASRVTCDPPTNLCGASQTNRYGTVIRATSSGSGLYYTWGTWAVKSP
jgi:hypothetical protein